MKLLNRLIYIYYRLFCNPISLYRKNGMIIGKNCDIKTWSLYSEAFLIEIGDHVQITSGVNIFTHTGGWTLRTQIPNFDSFGKVKIGDNVYIGNNALIMPGITIGNNVIIGAGTVVTKNIPDNVVVEGNPGKIVKTYDDFVKKYIKYNLNCKNLTLSEKKSLILNAPNEKLIKVDKYLNNPFDKL